MTPGLFSIHSLSSNKVKTQIWSKTKYEITLSWAERRNRGVFWLDSSRSQWEYSTLPSPILCLRLSCKPQTPSGCTICQQPRKHCASIPPTFTVTFQGWCPMSLVALVQIVGIFPLRVDHSSQLLQQMCFTTWRIFMSTSSLLATS